MKSSSDLLSFLNKKKTDYNKLIDDFEIIAGRMENEIASGAGEDKIDYYFKKLDKLNKNIIEQKKTIILLESAID